MARALDFPLLAGNPDPCLVDGTSYPLTVSLAGKALPLFAGGVVTRARLSQVARQTAELVGARYGGKRLLVVEVLEGGGVFGAMLAKELDGLAGEGGVRYERGRLKVRSYGQGSRAAELRVLEPLRGEHGEALGDCRDFEVVLLVDDLIDAGLTMHGLVTDYLPGLGAREIAICTMLDKARPRTTEVESVLARCLLSAGLRVPNLWLVGYGLDLALPGGEGVAGGLHLFRQALPGGVYAFNSEIESQLLAAYQRDPEDIRRQLAAYVSAG